VRKTIKINGKQGFTLAGSAGQGINEPDSSSQAVPFSAIWLWQ
jgi:hypothetical protein